MTAENDQPKKIQDIHRRKYLASIALLPELSQKRIKEYFQIIVSFIALIFAIVFAIEPTVMTISGLNRQLVDARQVNTALETKITALSQLNAQYDALQSVLTTNIYPAIPQSEDAQLLLAQIQAMIQENHLVATTLTAQSDPTSAGADPKDILFTVSVTGAYTDVRAFLQESVQFQRIILPTSITLSNTTGSNNLSLLISGKAYFKP